MFVYVANIENLGLNNVRVIPYVEVLLKRTDVGRFINN